MHLRVRRKTAGARDHLIVFLVDDATGRAGRVAKLEIGTGRWFVQPEKGWGPAEIPERGQLRAVKDAVERMVSSLPDVGPGK